MSDQDMRLDVGLLHYPVYNRRREAVASAVTTLDLHDISRSARTYDVRRFFVITPLEDQRRLVERVRRHWVEGYGARYNPDRRAAIELLTVVASLHQALERIREEEGERPLVVATDATGQSGRRITYGALRHLLRERRPVLLLFGTAWGLHRDVLEGADHCLAPIDGKSDYNHLSVRTAAGIILDRLVGRGVKDIEEE